MTGRALVKALGVELPDELLTMALTHRCYAYENGGLPTNERLEFLGDSVLGLVVTEALYHRHPDRSEGELAKLRASVVNTRALADVGRALPTTGSAPTCCWAGARRTPAAPTSRASWPTPSRPCSARSISSTAATVAREVVLRLFDPLIETAPTLGAGLDWKTSLQELTAARGLGVPAYW